jgi:hypothetical protein
MLYDVLVTKGNGAEYHGSFCLENAVRKAEKLHGLNCKRSGAAVAIRSESGRVIIF